MIIHKTDIDDVLIIEPRVFGDNRGWFTETYSKEKFMQCGIDNVFIQDNHSFSKQKGVLRGLHFQKNPKSQTKLVCCTRGKILDVVVDLRRGSSSYKKWVAVELTAENHKQLLVPKGFAHGFLTLTDDVEVQYKVDEYYSPECDRSVRFDDPQIGVEWGIDEPILSEKDINAPLLIDSDFNFSLKYMVTGFDGQLGYDVALELRKRHIDVIAPERCEFDLTDAIQTREYILSEKPDVIIHCAAYTAVDKAEDEKDMCKAINIDGTRVIAEAAQEINAKLVYISTDYVFDGLGTDPHSEDKETSPVNYYGYTKEQGEKIVKEMIKKYFIIRTSWVYGINGNNFVKAMLKLAETRKEISVVSDQIGAPTYTKDLAVFIADLVHTDNYGTYHGVNEGFCSWYEFAKLIFEKAGKDIKVNSISTKEYPTKAKRPLNSKLLKDNSDRIGIKRLPKWEDALTRFLEEYNNRED
jgi:dTDP-4-dehydrorhamnose reductase/dTDP-4-dehydrorhamnose 3,5-epimerase